MAQTLSSPDEHTIDPIDQLIDAQAKLDAVHEATNVPREFLQAIAAVDAGEVQEAAVLAAHLSPPLQAYLLAYQGKFDESFQMMTGGTYNFLHNRAITKTIIDLVTGKNREKGKEFAARLLSSFECDDHMAVNFLLTADLARAEEISAKQFYYNEGGSVTMHNASKWEAVITQIAETEGAYAARKFAECAFRNNDEAEHLKQNSQKSFIERAIDEGDINVELQKGINPRLSEVVGADHLMHAIVSLLVAGKYEDAKNLLDEQSDEEEYEADMVIGSVYKAWYSKIARALSREGRLDEALLFVRGNSSGNGIGLSLRDIDIIPELVHLSWAADARESLREMSPSVKIEQLKLKFREALEGAMHDTESLARAFATVRASAPHQVDFLKGAGADVRSVLMAHMHTMNKKPEDIMQAAVDASLDDFRNV